jgi:hypothetical protein
LDRIKCRDGATTKTFVLNRTLFRLFLTLSLLIAQAGAYQHALTHTQGDNQPATDASHFKACVKCLAYAETSAGLKSAHSLLIADAVYALPDFDAARSVSCCLLIGYSPRAPPLLS